MGTNKRCADAIDKRMSVNTDAIMRDRQPASLTKSELKLDRLPLKRTPVPIAARAWIHYDTIALRLLFGGRSCPSCASAGRFLAMRSSWGSPTRTAIARTFPRRWVH
ncbi:hypothetical protein GCM10007382_23360 [Salinibacterium xinjiangense]|nr:hypothetical protein GCM10007382_23360 [Salinibacterium xinjiangense]